MWHGSSSEARRDQSIREIVGILTAMTETANGGHDGRPPDRLPLRARLALIVGGLLLLAAFTVEALGITGNVHAWLPPLSAYLEPTFGEPAALLTCLATAAVVVGYGTSAASRLSWGRLLLLTWLTGVVWGFAVALLRGWNTGIVAVLDHPDEYLMDVDRVDGVTSLLSIYTDNILLVPDRSNFVTHNSGHPPLPLLSYAGLDAIGLGGPAWAGVITALVGSTAMVAVLVTLRRLGDERQARRTAPFLALSPLAIWVFVSADGAFMAVAAWGLAVLACAAVEQRPRRALALGVAAGVVLGGCLFLSYGLLLLGPLALAVLWVAGSWRPLVPAALAALAVVALFALGGFWWLEGQQLVVQRYYQGIADSRPQSYWIWANLAVVAFAVGPAVVAGTGMAVSPPPKAPGTHAVWWLAAGALVAIGIADLSGLSKSETERIWLPFMVWLVPLATLLPTRTHRTWVALQAVWTLGISLILRTTW